MEVSYPCPHFHRARRVGQTAKRKKNTLTKYVNDVIFAPMIFIETDLFKSQAKGLFDDEDIFEIQNYLLDHPKAGAVIRGSGGYRKLRWAAKGHGKRGGSRVIYFYYIIEQNIILVGAYAKNEKKDLTQTEIKRLRDMLP